MDFPMNAAYGKSDKPAEKPQAVTIFGYLIPGDSIWKVVLALFSIFAGLCFIIVVLLPSGFPFLAAKNSSGFFGYIGLFSAYMIGFFVILVLFFMAASLVAYEGRKLLRGGA